MSQVRLKICGLQPDDSLDFTSVKPVSHVGIVFVPESKRYVVPNSARQIVERLSRECTAVGVFANQSAAEVEHICKISGVRIAQLHGQETPQTCAMLRQGGLQVWKGIGVPRNGSQTDSLLEQMNDYLPYVDAILLDAAPPKSASQKVTGGHGVSFHWDVLKELKDRTLPIPVWVAGGLTPENVGDLLSTYAPSGVDVSSGVEVAGRKSRDRIEAMIKAVATYGTTYSVS